MNPEGQTPETRGDLEPAIQNYQKAVAYSEDPLRQNIDTQIQELKKTLEGQQEQVEFSE